MHKILSEKTSKSIKANLIQDLNKDKDGNFFQGVKFVIVSYLVLYGVIKIAFFLYSLQYN